MTKREEADEGWERDGRIDKEKKSGGGDDGLERRHEIRKRIGRRERGSDHMPVALFDLK